VELTVVFVLKYPPGLPCAFLPVQFLLEVLLTQGLHVCLHGRCLGKLTAKIPRAKTQKAPPAACGQWVILSAFVASLILSSRKYIEHGEQDRSMGHEALSRSNCPQACASTNEPFPAISVRFQFRERRQVRGIRQPGIRVTSNNQGW
jgi:hypothetical protein